MFELLLTLHIFSAIWLMSHLISSAYWKVRADRSGNHDQVVNTTQALVRSDLMFTGPGIVGLLLTGIWMGGMTGWDRFQEPWLAASFLLTLLVGVLWLAVLMPQQRKMARLAREIAHGNPDINSYRRSSKVWSMAGGMMTLIPLVVLFLMVFKP